MSVVKKKEVGRPVVITPSTLRKLEEVFALGGTDEEACLFGGIGKTTLYEFQKKNPEFQERKEALKQSPILKARKAVIEAFEDNPDLALKFLERRKKDEFSPRTEQTHSGQVQVTESAKESLLQKLREACEAREKVVPPEMEIGDSHLVPK